MTAPETSLSQDEYWRRFSVSPSILGTPVEEVHVGPSAPTGPTYELWFDTTTNTLMVKINDVWQPAAASPVDEVFIGPDTPPTPEAELWIDTDAVVLATGSDRLSVEVAQLRAEVAVLRRLVTSLGGGA